MPSKEAIQENNNRQQERAREYLKKYPEAVVGSMNWYGEDPEEEKIEKLREVISLLNFSYAFAIPHPDEKLFQMIAEYNKKDNENMFKKVETIFDRIDQLKGITFFWV